MKLEKLFDVKENRLYTVGGELVPAVAEMAKTVRWSDVEPEADSYDEAFLAGLREELKNAESEKKFYFIEPVFDRGADFAEGAVEQFTAAMKHCARRIKDCVSVAGFAIPQELVQAGFAPDGAAALYREALSEKHAQYVYFCKAAVEGVPSDIVLY
ncbi:MAG: hypothetical protein K6G80_06135 [Treponema sp.]|nr:hypothetical protein [Treponema sp.]